MGLDLIIFHLVPYSVSGVLPQDSDVVSLLFPRKLLLRVGYGRAKKVRHGSSRSTSGERRRGKEAGGAEGESVCK